PEGPSSPRPSGARTDGRPTERRDAPWTDERPPRRTGDARGPRPPGRPTREPNVSGHRPEPAFEPARGPERSSRRPSPTWNEPAATERPPRPGRPPAAGPNTAFGARPASRPPRPALEPARRHQPAADAPPPAPPAASTSAPGSLRLSKYMGELGIASRREADEWIAKGWVRVDGRVVSELGSRVVPGQHVTVDAQARHVQAQKVTVLVHKPVGYVSGQAEDGYEPALVLVKPANQWSEDRSGTRWIPQHLRSLVPAGRLDIDSVGLLVLTQDGRVAKQLIGEHSDVEKEYLVRVAALEGDGTLTDEGLALLRHGLELDGEPLREAVVEWVNEDQLRFVLREGKKRQIRRMCEAVGLKVLGLKRVRIGRVMLGDLPVGQWRYLRADEGFA
ncbi:MAG: pseudouridine synthase, partial [Ideonella sp.]|nr:pseudouridine synthase [Ideonella sp.]